MNMAYGVWMVRSRQTSKTCSFSASWCHTFEHLSPDSPPPWSFSLWFSDGTSQSSYDHPRCTATCCKLRPLRSEGEEESMSGVPLARKSWCPCIINSILTDKAKWNTEILTYTTQHGCKGHVPLRDMQRDYTTRSVDTETTQDIAASPQLQQLIPPHQALLSFFPCCHPSLNFLKSKDTLECIDTDNCEWVTAQFSDIVLLKILSFLRSRTRSHVLPELENGHKS